MEFLMELILEIILEGTIEVSKSKKIPKFVRFLAIFMVLLFFILVIGLIILAGILFLKKSIMVGVCLILLDLFLAITSILKFFKIYLLKLDD